MLREPLLRLPVPEPLALIDATLLFLIQVLLAQHPDLLAPPEAPVPHPPPGLRTARHLFDAVRELHELLDLYRTDLPDAAPCAGLDNDDFPF